MNHMNADTDEKSNAVSEIYDFDEENPTSKTTSDCVGTFALFLPLAKTSQRSMTFNQCTYF